MGQAPKHFDAIVLGDPFANLGTARVGIGTANPNAYAILELNANSNNPKVLLLTRISTAQRDAMSLGAGYGFLTWTVGVGLQYYDGTGWKTVTAS